MRLVPSITRFLLSLLLVVQLAAAPLLPARAALERAVVDIGLSFSLTGGGAGVGSNATSGGVNNAGVATGITTEGALDVDVVRGTEVVGGLIVSKSGELTLVTETLKVADLDLHDNNSQLSGNVGVNIGTNAQGVTPPGVTVEGSYANREVEGIARGTIGEGDVTVRSQTEEETEIQLAAINRDPDKAVEVTNIKEEGFELYLSDTSVKAAAEVVAKVVERLKEKIEEIIGRKLTDEEIARLIQCDASGVCRISSEVSGYGLDAVFLSDLETAMPGLMARIEDNLFGGALGAVTSQSQGVIDTNIKAFWLAYSYADQIGDGALKRALISEIGTVLGAQAALYEGGGLGAVGALYSALPVSDQHMLLSGFGSGVSSALNGVAADAIMGTASIGGTAITALLARNTSTKPLARQISNTLGWTTTRVAPNGTFDDILASYTPKKFSPTRRDVDNPDLRNIENSNYGVHANGQRVGNGSTSDALRFENETGHLLSSSGHRQKAVELRTRYQNWLKRVENSPNPNSSGTTFTSRDIEYVRLQISDLTDALGQ